jgi:hypothetical protein
MTAIFPDSGVPPANAKNSLPDPDTQNCNELWYDTGRCQPRFDPAQANAVIAELVNTINGAECVYNCDSLAQLNQAVKYHIQRGLPVGSYLAQGPFDYYCALDPALTRYNDFLTLVIVPNVNNQGAVRIDCSNRGMVPVLRNDGRQLESSDLRAERPEIISYWNGNFYVVGLVQSQTLIITGEVDLWIRTDGNDTTGDGSANDPTKAFRTIRGAWLKAGARFAQTPTFAMNFKLGIPGTYEGAGLGPFGGTVRLIGDTANRGGYRLASIDGGGGLYINLAIGGMSYFEAQGITFMRDVGAPNQCVPLWCSESIVVARDCNFDASASNNQGSFITVNGGRMMLAGAVCSFYGRNLAIGTLIKTDINGVFAGGDYPNTDVNFVECAAQHCSFYANNGSLLQWAWATIYPASCTGKHYAVELNAIMSMFGRADVGDQPGQVATGGQFTP